MKKHIINYKKKEDTNYIKYNKNFKKCIGTGRMALSLRQDYMDNLKIIQKEIGFQYIRGHGIFNDEMGVYREAIQMGATNVMKLEYPIFNFKNILRVFDNFLSVGIKPFVEFGFMPSQMASGDKTVFWWNGNVSDPKDMNLWSELIEKFLQTVIDYFGINEVKDWYFEVWNEPCVNFWQPKSGMKEEEYYKLYELTARKVKEANVKLKVGGPATQEQGIDWIPRFSEYCKLKNIPLDFVSHHIYTGIEREFDGEFVYMKHVQPKEAIAKFERARHIADSAPQGCLPLHITEWNTSYSCIDMVHDIAFNAAYVAYLLTHADHLAESYAYWVFCDVFEEADIPRALFHGGFGLLTENGIRKPSFHAFAFANKLKDKIIHIDELSCITQDEDDNFAILLFNPCIDSFKGETVEVEFELPCKTHEVFISVEKVDNQNGNAHTTWQNIGRPRWPNKEQMDIIVKAQNPGFESFKLKSNNQKIRFSAVLPGNGIQLIQILKVIDYSNTYQGLRCNE